VKKKLASHYTHTHIGQHSKHPSLSYHMNMYAQSAEEKNNKWNMIKYSLIQSCIRCIYHHVNSKYTAMYWGH